MVAERTAVVIADTVDGFTGTETPDLSWSTETDAPGWMQRSAEIAIERGGRTGAFPVDGPRAHAVAWPDAPLGFGEVAVVRVRVTGERGSTGAWSDPVAVTGGVLASGEWAAAFVSTGADEPALLRDEFELGHPVRRALLLTSAFGAVRVHVNGQRVGDHELAPGWTSYQWRVGYDTADVTALLRPGRNALGIELFGGWQTEAFGFRDAARRFYGGLPRAATQLVLELDSGEREALTMGANGRWARGGTRSSGLYRGEEFDAALQPVGWSTPGFDASGWRPVVVHEPDVVPSARIAPPVRVTAELPAVVVGTAASGATVLDFGQNITGRLRVRVRAPRGTRITLRHAEVLIDGELATRPLRNAAATDVFVAAGAGDEVWEPAGTFHGFRYAEVAGWPGPLDPAMVTARVLGTDLRRVGGFATSHPLLQRFHDNVVWGARDNFLSVPTDCPQRDERLGWTGDIQVFAPTAAFLYDCDAFLRSWLRDLRLEQGAAGGVVPMVVPAVIPQVPGLFDPIAAWGDAVTVVPWVLQAAFGGHAALAENYEGMRQWVAVVRERAGDSLLWEDGKQFGDWLDPDAPPDQPGMAKTDADIVATAYFHRSVEITGRVAAELGREHEASEYRLLAAGIRAAFQRAYLTPGGRMMSDAATAYALAIVFELVDPEHRPVLGRRLRHLVRRSGYCISTGFVGTPIVCEALSLTGHDDAAARLLLQTENPSWLYPVTMGATTIWERWDSLLEDGSLNPGQMTSFNHYALGGVADWMHRRVGGITPIMSAYSRFRFAPVVLEGLDDATVWHDSPYGRIEAGWERVPGGARVWLVVPPNTTAVVELPGAEAVEVGAGRFEWMLALEPRTVDVARLDLDSPLTDVLEAPGAYRAVMDALHAWDPERARSIRRTIQWTPGRPLRDPLGKVPLPVLARIESALARLDAVPPSAPSREVLA